MEIVPRKSRPGDWLAIEELHHRASRKMPQLWWWEEHLTDDSFVVVERDESITGVLFAWPDRSPVAWIRLAAVDNGLDVDEWLDLALPPIITSLRHQGAQALAWMDYQGWAEPHLTIKGFRPLTEVITLAKLDCTLPLTGTPGVYLRPAADADIPAVVAVDRAAFTPHWWHSEETMYRRAARSPHFAVAEIEGEVVGYVEGEARIPIAHLNRIAVHPSHQGHGVGRTLLSSTLRTFWQAGAERITLNTQADNTHSQRLYRRFGFEPTGDTVTVWELHL
jgi:GNAT superfamily N-acetyltransferase